MKKFLSVFCIILFILFILVLGILLGLKIKNDADEQEASDILSQNITNEAEYVCSVANECLNEIISKIEEDTLVEVQVADTGTLDNTDVYFVTLVDGEYMYITKDGTSETQIFTVAEDNDDSARYIVSLQALGFDTLVYTSLSDYNIDSTSTITYVGNN